MWWCENSKVQPRSFQDRSHNYLHPATGYWFRSDLISCGHLRSWILCWIVRIMNISLHFLATKLSIGFRLCHQIIQILKFFPEKSGRDSHGLVLFRSDSVRPVVNMLDFDGFWHRLAQNQMRTGLSTIPWRAYKQNHTPEMPHTLSISPWNNSWLIAHNQCITAEMNVTEI